MAQAKITELTEHNTCKICDNALAKYSCPRCNILYCSLPCYRSEKHIECSESFYKDCVKEHLSVDDDATGKKKMTEILRKLYGENSEYDVSDEDNDDDDDDDDDNLVDRFQNVDLDSQTADEIWSKLKKDEQQEFIAFLRSGDVTKLVPAWEPWWMFHEDQKIKEIDSNMNEYEEKCPKLVRIKDFSKLMAKPPADSVKYNLMNVLSSYALMARYFNGEYFDFGKEAASCLINNSLCLKTNHNFEDFETAVKSVEQQCLNTDWIVVDQENIIKMREDLHHILKGPCISNKKYYILSALSDIHRLMKEALKENSEENPNSFDKKIFPEGVPKVILETDDKIKQSLRKIDYLLSYTKDCFTYD